MKDSQMYLLGSYIFISPTLPELAGLVLGIACFVLSMIYQHKD